MFKPAARRNSKLRLALSGTSGSGKTYTALQIAKMFSDRIALADSERGSSQKYALKASTKEGPGNWRFEVADIEEKNPVGYMNVIREAAAQGFGVLVIDSYSHSWLGALEQVDKSTGASKFTSGWKAVSPQVSKLVDRILDYPGHVIATMRSKSEFALEEVNGKKVPRKIGMQTVAREGTEYEFDLMLDLSDQGTLTITKSRCGDGLPVGYTFDRDEIPKVVAKVKAWLDEGAPLSPLESVLERLRYATIFGDLIALVPAVKDLSPEDRAAVKQPWEAKKAELADQAAIGEGVS
jgi:hypothetical protein